MFEVGVKVNINEVDLAGAVANGLRELAIEGERFMKRASPVDTGRYRASVAIDIVNDFFITIGPHVDYAEYVENDTRPHMILPKNKKALRFEAGKTARLARKGPKTQANIVFSKGVKHPGTTGQHVVQRTAEHLDTKVGDIMERAMGGLTNG